ncbi:MAG: cupin domain-containing protein [Verrucomicrobiae bacterium]|nr:cupin domain-containing protein [Verrucomicrobiae bacterium]
MKTKVVNLQSGRTFVKNGIGSRTVNEACRYRCIQFVFDAGQELSEHTAAVPAVMHFLEGKAQVRLGRRTLTAGPGTWIHMAPHQPHSIKARTRLAMLLTMFVAPDEGCHCGCQSKGKACKCSCGCKKCSCGRKR